MSATHKLELLRHRLASAIARGDVGEITSCRHRISNLYKLVMSSDA